MQMGELLRQSRERAGFTQEELAEKSGVTLGSIRNAEQWKRLPTFPLIVRLAAALGVSCEAFALCDDVTGPSEEPERPAMGKRK